MCGPAAVPAAGRRFGDRLHVGTAVAVDEAEERHRLAAEGMDHVPIIDDLVVLAAGMRPSTWQGDVPPTNTSRRSS
jgi:hypothetical protein